MNIEDFPGELIEEFAPDLEPETIRNLKLVNKRFYSVFNADRFYEKFLCRPEKEHRVMLRSECKGRGVRDVAEKIRTGELGRWRGCVELEKTHHRNWKNARLEAFDELPFPSNLHLDIHQTDFQDIVDEEHWILCSVPESKNRGSYLFLFNVTAKAELIFKKQFPIYSLPTARLLPGQVAVFREGRNNWAPGRWTVRRAFDVYNVVRNAEGFSLEFQWSIDCSAETTEPRSAFEGPERVDSSGWNVAIVSGRDGRSEGHTVLVASCNGERERGQIHVWNLKTGKKIGRFDLTDREAWRDMRTRDYRQREITIYEGEFPYVIVNINDEASSHITLFNVLTTEVTLVDQDVRSLDDRWCRMVGRYVIADLVTEEPRLFGESRVTELRLYYVGLTGERCRLLLKTNRGSPSFLSFLSDRVLVTFNQKNAPWNPYGEGFNFTARSTIITVYFPLEVNVYALKGDSAVLERSFWLSNQLRPNDFIAFVDPDLLVFLTSKAEWRVYNLKGEVLSSCNDIGLSKTRRTTWHSYDYCDGVFRGQSTTGLHLFLTRGGKSARCYYF